MSSDSEKPKRTGLSVLSLVIVYFFMFLIVVVVSVVLSVVLFVFVFAALAALQAFMTVIDSWGLLVAIGIVSFSFGLVTILTVSGFFRGRGKKEKKND
jgi:hypothetical protein